MIRQNEMILANKFMRECKLEHDLRKDDRRYQVYQVKPHTLYALVVKELGEVVQFRMAQNPITLLMEI